MKKDMDYTSKSGIYRIIGTINDCEIFTKQRSRLTKTVSWEPCYRNPFNGDFLECWNEVRRREKAIQAIKRTA
jgi:hypothetical protein